MNAKSEDNKQVPTVGKSEPYNIRELLYVKVTSPIEICRYERRYVYYILETTPLIRLLKRVIVGTHKYLNATTPHIGRYYVEYISIKIIRF